MRVKIEPGLVWVFKMDENKEAEADSSGYHENNLPINLPQAFRDLKFAKRMAIDIGKGLIVNTCTCSLASLHLQAVR